MNERPSSRPSWNSGERRILRELLAAPGLRFLRLPTDLEQAYQAHHTALSLRNIRQFWPLVAGGYVAIVLLTALSGVMVQQMGRDLLVGFGVLAAGISLAVLGAVVPALQRHHERFVWFAAYAALVAMHVGTLLTRHEPMLLSMAQFGVTYITVATLTISNLTFRRAMAAAVGAMATFGLIVAVVGIFPDPAHFLFYSLAAILVGGTIGVTNEIRERTVFLQERLLAFERNELDVLTHELAALSRQDPLTGLANRRRFDEELAREWTIAERERTELSLLFLDVDFFKRFNDRYGHPAGDECLERVAHTLAAALRSVDLVARYGGEEFVVLLPRTGTETAKGLAARLIDAVDDLGIPHADSDAAPHVTISIGMATMVPTASHSSETLVGRADAALYRAKHAGRHRFEAD